MCEQVLGCQEAKRKDWITDDTWEAIESRRVIKMKLNKEADDTRKAKLRQEYQERNKRVKQKTKRDKKIYVTLRSQLSKTTPESYTRSPDN